jgi:IS30 family transposase
MQSSSSAPATGQVTRGNACYPALPPVQTLTLDNGTEFHDYAVLEQRFPVRVYFATLYHSWEGGSNENFNGLLRQYLPKGVCMSAVTQAQCDHIAADLNNRPRKRYGFDTPAQRYYGN